MPEPSALPTTVALDPYATSVTVTPYSATVTLTVLAGVPLDEPSLLSDEELLDGSMIL